ncbi:MAG: ABC transporter substrate-binding protein [Candidatus Eisenbacteria bacterium]|nr:ABC transporter substrate-binding protein [Candidatus Latescibacterota bacterium]MBD3303142.1 ABC transporter substrate-binding protein [Candidatus Eisenbacteria bacterium]
MSFSRRTVRRLTAGVSLLLAGSLLGVAPPGAAARDRAEIEIKIATLAPEGSTWMKMMDELDAEIRERTNGEAGLKIYPGGIQGDETVVLRKIRAGQLHGGGFTGTGLGEIAPPLRVLEVPFTFKTIAEVRAVQQALGPRFEEILREAGWELLGWADVGFVYLFSKDPIRSVDDLRSSRMWLWEGDPLAETFLKTVGISPVPLPITDVVTSLQTGLIDAVYTSPMACIALQWFTRVSSMTDLPVTYAMGAVVVRKKTFDKLSPEAQAVVKDASAKWFARLGDATAEENDESIAVLRDRGIEVIALPPERKSAFRDVGREVRQELVGTLFDQEMLDRMLSALDDARAGAGGSAP